ncbi:hypothetical protein H6P81_004911 [Aristolochia fimbriata]|uniref:Uncharacterized protein n=1 Tax=Aristolochia fimbriata TaxID=158543 RepID=A0AAV7EWK3_ARIFI|nr:hypothetical protein H6P81_004911 [Aristolochia fimbriata]
MSPHHDVLFNVGVLGSPGLGNREYQSIRERLSVSLFDWTNHGVSVQKADKLQSKPHHKRTDLRNLSDRRQLLLCSGSSLIAVLSANYSLFAPLPTKAEGENQKGEVAEDDKGVFDTFKTFFDPNENTKTGKVLPKAFLKSAREVVKNLRESLKEDAKDITKFRKAADAAKESIREYLNGWKGQPAVASEESYVALEKAIRSLASFYSKSGPFAPLPEEKQTVSNGISRSETAKKLLTWIQDSSSPACSWDPSSCTLVVSYGLFPAVSDSLKLLKFSLCISSLVVSLHFHGFFVRSLLLVCFLERRGHLDAMTCIWMEIGGIFTSSPPPFYLYDREGEPISADLPSCFA